MFNNNLGLVEYHNMSPLQKIILDSCSPALQLRLVIVSKTLALAIETRFIMG